MGTRNAFGVDMAGFVMNVFVGKPVMYFVDLLLYLDCIGNENKIGLIGIIRVTLANDSKFSPNFRHGVRECNGRDEISECIVGTEG